MNPPVDYPHGLFPFLFGYIYSLLLFSSLPCCVVLVLWYCSPEDVKLGISVVSRRLFRLLVLLNMAVCVRESWRCGRSSVVVLLLLVLVLIVLSLSGVGLSNWNRRDGVDGVTRADVLPTSRIVWLREDGASRRRGRAEVPKEALSGGDVGCSREIFSAGRNPLTSVTAREGARMRVDSSSSSAAAFRFRTRSEVFRPS